MSRKKKISDYLKKEHSKWISSVGEMKTRKEFAEYLDVDDYQLRSWMKAKSKPSNENVIKIGNKLGPEIYDLLEWIRPKNQ